MHSPVTLAARQPPFVITHRSNEATVLAECPLFLKDDRLLLIGPKEASPRTASRDIDSQK